MTGGAPWAAWLWVASIALRGAFGLCIERAMGAVRTPLWLPAIRDVLSMAVLLAAYMGDEVAWRGHKLTTGKDTRLTAGRAVLAQRRG